MAVVKNNPTIIDRVQDALDRNKLVPEGAGVLVGVSGGPDSMALLDILRRIGGFPLRAAHLNHRLRPGDCDADEELVRAYCRAWRIGLDIASVDVADLARSSGLGIEAAGREARHAFFATCATRWLESPEIDPIAPPVRQVMVALAHHLDDQAETILLHLGRGCGLDGLVGMQAHFASFIRPLLGIRRTELLEYLAAHQVDFRLDQTNEELFTLRNRLRQQVLPTWKAALGYDPATVLTRTAELVSDDQVLLTELAEDVWKRIARINPADSRLVILDLKAFRLEPAAIQNRILRLAWRQASGEFRDIEWRHLRLVREFVRESDRRSGHLDWPQNIVIELNADAMCIFRVERIPKTPRSETNSLHNVTPETRFSVD